MTEFFACVHTGCYRFRILPFAASLSERWGEGQEIRGSAGGLGNRGSRGRGVVAAVPQDAPNVSPRFDSAIIMSLPLDADGNFDTRSFSRSCSFLSLALRGGHGR